MNPFLVIGGVAVTVATAAIGILAVPGWINSAHDSAARSDLEQVAVAQEAAMATGGAYVDGLAALRDADQSVQVQPSDGVHLFAAADEAGTSWVAAAQSKSGAWFARAEGSSVTGEGDDLLTALDDAGAGLVDGATPAGVPWSFTPDPLATMLSSFGATHHHIGLIDDFPGDTPTAVRVTRLNEVEARILDVKVPGMPHDGEGITVTFTVRASEPADVKVYTREKPSGYTGPSSQLIDSVRIPAGVSTITVTGAAYRGDAGPSSGITITGAGTVGATMDFTDIRMGLVASG